MPGLGTTPDESGFKSPSGGAVHSPGIYARAKVGLAMGRTMKKIPQIALAAALLAALPNLGGWLRPLEELATDLMMRARGTLAPDSRIVVCAVDAASVHKLGRWPWRRTRVAELIDRLKAEGARVIALDVVFSDPSPKAADFDLSGDDRALDDSLRKAGNVVLGYFFRGEPG